MWSFSKVAAATREIVGSPAEAQAAGVALYDRIMASGAWTLRRAGISTHTQVNFETDLIEGWYGKINLVLAPI